MAAPLDDALAQTDRGLTPAWPIDPGLVRNRPVTPSRWGKPSPLAPVLIAPEIASGPSIVFFAASQWLLMSGFKVNL